MTSLDTGPGDAPRLRSTFKDEGAPSRPEAAVTPDPEPKEVGSVPVSAIVAASTVDTTPPASGRLRIGGARPEPAPSGSLRINMSKVGGTPPTYRPARPDAPAEIAVAAEPDEAEAPAVSPERADYLRRLEEVIGEGRYYRLIPDPIPNSTNAHRRRVGHGERATSFSARPMDADGQPIPGAQALDVTELLMPGRTLQRTAPDGGVADYTFGDEITYVNDSQTRIAIESPGVASTSFLPVPDIGAAHPSFDTTAESYRLTVPTS